MSDRVPFVTRTIGIYQMVEELMENEVDPSPNILDPKLFTYIMGGSEKQVRPTVEGFVKQLYQECPVMNFGDIFV